MASGGATVKLEAKDGGTLLAYDVDANVAGKIAQLGSRLIDATARQLAEKFFTSFRRRGRGAGEAAECPAVAAPAGGIPAAVWWVGRRIAACHRGLSVGTLGAGHYTESSGPGGRRRA